MTDEGGEPGAVLRLVHHHPGRCRLRCDAFVDDDAAAQPAVDALLATPSVSEVVYDDQTGSVLIEHEPGRVTPDALAEIAARAAGASLSRGEEPRRDPCHGARFVGACRRMNAVTEQLTGHRIELRTLVPAVLAGMSVGIFFLGAGPRLPRWDSLAYWSVTLFAMLHGRELGSPPGPGGSAGPA